MPRHIQPAAIRLPDKTLRTGLRLLSLVTFALGWEPLLLSVLDEITTRDLTFAISLRRRSPGATPPGSVRFSERPITD